MEFFATCPLGFERLLADELTSLRTPHVRPLKGQVAFDGELADAYRVCLWSHLASRVVAVLARTDAGDSDALYDGLSQIAWEQHLPAGASFAIDAHGTNAQLRNTQFVALRSKDAVTDRLLARTGARPITNVAAPDLQVVVRISRDRATVGIDFAGEALFRRGYEATRTSSAIPSLRPDYAAALLACGGWPQLAQDGATLVAPFCGGGTIACEAACWALDRAPGLLRGRWGFMGWRLHDADAWQRLLDEARQRAREAENRELRLVLDDPRAGFETTNRQALRAAGIAAEPAFGPGGPRHGGSPTLLACDLDIGDASNIFFIGILVFVKSPTSSVYALNTSLIFLFEKLESSINTHVPSNFSSSILITTLSSYLSLENTLLLETITNVSIILELKKMPSPE